MYYSSIYTHGLLGERLPGEVESVHVGGHGHPPVHGVVVHHTLAHVVELRRQSCRGEGGGMLGRGVMDVVLK